MSYPQKSSIDVWEKAIRLLEWDHECKIKNYDDGEDDNGDL